MPPFKRPGIFCLEGEWDTDLRSRDSVEPLLQLLEHLKVAKTIHRDVATYAELEYYLHKWTQAGYKDFPILYLAAHGEEGLLRLGRESVTMEQLGLLLKDRCRGRVIYFGSCLTLNRTDDELTAFVKQVGAKALVGYYREIDWLESASFELLLLDRLCRGSRSDAFFKQITREHGAFAGSLGLVVATKTKVMDAG